MENEIWKPVLGYEGYYEVSDRGRVKSLNYNHTGVEKILKPSYVRNYARVGFRKNKKKHMYFVYHLVWEAFNGPIPEGMQVNHINEDKTDNRLCNLNLMTPKENINWGSCIQRRSLKKQREIEQYDTSGNLLKTWNSIKDITTELGFAKSSISSCCNGDQKTAYGFIWKQKRAGV